MYSKRKLLRGKIAVNSEKIFISSYMQQVPVFKDNMLSIWSENIKTNLLCMKTSIKILVSLSVVLALHNT